jgi:hypothetical protein
VALWAVGVQIPPPTPKLPARTWKSHRKVIGPPGLLFPEISPPAERSLTPTSRGGEALEATRQTCSVVRLFERDHHFALAIEVLGIRGDQPSDEHRPERPVLLAVDQQSSDRMSLQGVEG